jgi:hypothetical protein
MRAAAHVPNICREAAYLVITDFPLQLLLSFEFGNGWVNLWERLLLDDGIIILAPNYYSSTYACRPQQDICIHSLCVHERTNERHNTHTRCIHPRLDFQLFFSYSFTLVCNLHCIASHGLFIIHARARHNRSVVHIPSLLCV